MKLLDKARGLFLFTISASLHSYPKETETVFPLFTILNPVEGDTLTSGGILNSFLKHFDSVGCYKSAGGGSYYINHYDLIKYVQDA